MTWEDVMGTADTIVGSVWLWKNARAVVPADDDDSTVANVIGGCSGGGINSPRGERRGDTIGAERRGEVRRGVAADVEVMAGDFPRDSLSRIRKALFLRADNTTFHSSLVDEWHHGQVWVGVQRSQPRFCAHGSQNGCLSAELLLWLHENVDRCNRQKKHCR